MRRFLVLATAATIAAAHGSLSFPQPRNQFKHNYCPHCANGSGVCGGSGGQWEHSSEPDLWDTAFVPPKTYITAGGTLEIEYYITAAHLGHFTLEICYRDGSSSRIEEACFQRLERDPTDTTFSPYTPKQPTFAYLPQNTCAASYSKSNPMRLRFKVPAGKTANHAVLRWFWQTGNSCAANVETMNGKVDSTLAAWKLGKCGVATSGGSLCGSDCPRANCGGEHFKNCADVIVSASGIQNVNSKNYQKEGDVITPSPSTTAPVYTTTTTPVLTTTVPVTIPTTVPVTIPTTTVPVIIPTTVPVIIPTTTVPVTVPTTTVPVTVPTTTTTAGNADTTHCHMAPVEHCQMMMKGQQQAWEGVCKQFCRVYAHTKADYCTAKGFDQDANGLIGCILIDFWARCMA